MKYPRLNLNFKANVLPTLASIILLLSLSAVLINYYIYKYPGNNYFPAQSGAIIILLVIFYLGLVIYFGKNHKKSRMGLELLRFFAVMSVIALATNAAQLTPFPIIDKYILALETILHIDFNLILQWTYSHSFIAAMLKVSYASLAYQMCIIPLLLIGLSQYSLLNNYYFLLFFTTIIGFSFYYFFPTIAPASMIKNSLFTQEQFATGIKFQQIHHHIAPSTIEGGLIALPSFHCIWAIFCTYLLQKWRVLFFFSFILNSLLIVSCVLLGWHYPIDLIAGALLAFFAIYLLKFLPERYPK